MKKSLIALAVFGAFSGAAMAADSVQLYGLIDLGVAHFNNDGSSSVTKMGTGGQSGSRIGLKGSEDLGGGLSAFFQVETGFCAAGGGDYCTGGNFMGRTSIVGLHGDFGTVQAGKMYTLTFNDQANVDPFGYGLMGNIANIAALGAPARVNQTIAYVSPNFSGFDVAGAYVFGNGLSATNTKTTGGYNLQAHYANGPVWVGLDYLRVNDANGDATTKSTMLAGTYDFGVAKVAAMYGQNKPTADAKTGALVNTNQQAWMLGVTVPVGPGAVLASYTQAKDKDVAASTSKQWALGYTYALSKRTNLYTSYGHVSNDANATGLVNDSTGNNDAPVPTAGGFTSTGFDVGIRHKF